jgi:DNA-directed RNA polymerase specialized sigma24 family protein
MHCGKSLRAIRRRNDSLQILSVAEDADICGVTLDMLNHQQGWPEPRYPSTKEVATALDQLNGDQQAQFIIRRYGLDGQPRRSIAAIAREAGISPSSVRGTLKRALLQLCRLLIGWGRYPAASKAAK